MNLEGSDHFPLAAITPYDDQGLLNFPLLDYFCNYVIYVFDTNKCSDLCLAVLVFVLELCGLVVVTKSIQVLGEGRVDALLEHVLADDIPDGMEHLLHLLVGDGYRVSNVANMSLGDEGPSLRPGGLKMSACLNMTAKIVSVLGVVVTALDTPIHTNLFFLPWLFV